MVSECWNVFNVVVMCVEGFLRWREIIFSTAYLYVGVCHRYHTSTKIGTIVPKQVGTT